VNPVGYWPGVTFLRRKMTPGSLFYGSIFLLPTRRKVTPVEYWPGGGVTFLSRKMTPGSIFYGSHFSPLHLRPSVCASVSFYIFDFFSRTTGPILSRLGTNHPWRKGIHVSSNEGNSPSLRGDNSGRVKMHWQFLKIFFSRTSRPNLVKLITNYPCVKGIQISSNEGPGPLQRGDTCNNKN
jgi:hypothetical protein